MKVLSQGQLITSNVYCEHLDNLATSIREKRRRLCSDHFFVHDNARPHTARQTVDKLNELGFDVLPHPPYSPDLSPSDYLFHPMKNELRGKQYNNSQEIVTDIIAWFQTEENGFFRKAFDLLPEVAKMCQSKWWIFPAFK